MSPSAPQINQRRKFTRAVACFRKQPQTGGATPPDLGPRGRDRWYDDSASSGLFYYNYFMRETLNALRDDGKADWCVAPSSLLKHWYITNANPDTTYTGGNWDSFERGNASASGIWTGNSNSLVSLACYKINCDGEYPSFLSLEIGVDFDVAHVFVVPATLSTTWNHSTWNNMTFNFNGTPFYTAPAGYNTVNVPLIGFPVINNECSLIIGQSVPANYRVASGHGSTAIGYTEA